MKRSIIFLTITSLITLNGLAATRDLDNQEDNVQCAKLSNDEKVKVKEYRQENFFDTTKKDEHGDTQLNKTINMCYRQKDCDQNPKPNNKGFSCNGVSKPTDFCNSLLQAFEAKITESEKNKVNCNSSSSQ